MAREDDKFMLRLPEGWRHAIKARAVINRRSMNQEILVALEGLVGEAAGADLGGHAPAAGTAQHLIHQGRKNHAAE